MIRVCCFFAFLLARALLFGATISIVTDNSDKLEGTFLFKGTILKMVAAASNLGYETRHVDPACEQYVLRQSDYIIDLTTNSAFAVANRDRYPGKIIVFLWEPPTNTPRVWLESVRARLAAVFTFFDPLIDHKKYFKIHYPVLWQLGPGWAGRSYAARTLCTMMSANKDSYCCGTFYPARRRIINFFEKNLSGDFEFYGRYWPRKYKNYRGAPADYSCIGNYRFCFCYENVSLSGYITEKIFACFGSGVIPVYLGASNITDYVPKGCFIDAREFGSLAECYQYLKSVDEETFNDYLSNIKKYMSSESAKQFTWEHLADEILDGFRQILRQRGASMAVSMYQPLDENADVLRERDAREISVSSFYPTKKGTPPIDLTCGLYICDLKSEITDNREKEKYP